jgi:DNA-binding CsgD family transcriptional regulator/tetratricopeptide (TPR) repeat protein
MKRKNLAKPELGELAQLAVAFAVMLGGEVELHFLGALGVETETLDALFDRGMLLPAGPGRAALATTVNREEAISSLAWSECRKARERLAELLERNPETRVAAAAQYAQACRYPEARRLYVRVAEAACHEKRYMDALTALEAALRIWPADEEVDARLRILTEMARCARNCTQHALARRALREILEMPAASLDVSTLVDAHHQLADLALLEGDSRAARRHLEAAAELAEKSAGGEEAARAWFAVASYLADQLRPVEAERALDRAVKLAGPECEPGLRSELLGFQGLLCAMRGDAKTARAKVNDALALAVKHNLSAQAAIAYRRQANIREYCSDYAGERDAHLHAIALCRKGGQKESEHSCLTCLSYVFFRTGEWKRAIETARKVDADETAHPALKAGALGVRAMIAAFRGEQRQTVAQLREAAVGLRRYGILSLEFHLRWAQAFSELAGGDEAAAALTYAQLLDWWENTSDVHDVVPGAMCAAGFFADRGEAQRVAQATDLLHAVVAANDNEETRAARQAVLGEAARVAGDLALAVTRLGSARDGYDRLGTPIERAMTRCRLARALEVLGREREAAEARESCASIAKQIGMRPVIEWASPPSSGKPRGSVSEALTGRQSDVLRLLAAGLTNKEAADRLHLSPRTVEMHVASLLNRLNCRTRAEAIHRAGELGWLK